AVLAPGVSRRLSHIHAVEDHRWTQINTDGTCSESRFSKRRIRSSDSDPNQRETRLKSGPRNLCSSVFICGCIESLRLMSNTFTATPRRLTLIGAILALLGSVSLPSIAQAQQQSGSNLILDTDRNRASGEPRGVITSGGPSADEVKRRLQQRIEEQSEGQITLFGYRQISVKAPDVELGGKPACAVEFEAGIESQPPGAWQSRYRGRPLTFFLIKPFADLSGADNWHPFRIEAKGERFVMQGYALFIPGENGW